MNFLFCGYRDWAISVFNNLEKKFDEDNFFLAKSNKQFLEYQKYHINFDIIFFVGWSWIIEEDFVANNKCICVHPSPLPKYRGGSPIQHQIISGEKHSKVTAFLMNDKIDAGPIYAVSYAFNLDGNLSDVLTRISVRSIFCLTEIIKNLKENTLVEIKQEEKNASYFSRRKPKDSEILPEDFKNCTAEEIYNKIRSLQDPYPNTYIVCGDGSKVYLTMAKIDD